MNGYSRIRSAERIEIVDPYAAVMPKEDLAVEREELLESDALKKAVEKGFISPAIGMARLTNILGGKYYARICVDEDGNRRIEIRQKYEAGNYSPIIRIRQSDFLRAAHYKFGEANIQQKKLKNAVENFIFKLSSECLDKFDGMMSFDVEEVLNALWKSYQSLPVCKDFYEEETPAEFYKNVIKSLEDHYLIGGDFDEIVRHGHKAYYPLTSDEIQIVAVDLDMKKSELLKKLKEYNFLYLTESSKAYQTNVRVTLIINGKDYINATEWRYCLCRLEYFAQVDEK